MGRAVVVAGGRRDGWHSLALLVAIGAGVVLAAVTAGRRADSAFPRFVAAHGYDAILPAVSASRSSPGAILRAE